MSFSVLKLRSGARAYSSKFLLVLAVVALLTNTAYAGVLTATPASVTLTCNTVTGPGTAATIVIKPGAALVSPNTIVVLIGTLPPGVVATVTPVNQTLSSTNATAGIAYTINYAPGCAGATTGVTTPTFSPTAAGSAGVTVTVNSTVTATTSGLTTSPSTVALTCVLNAGSYTRSPVQTVSITSGATGGTPITLDAVNTPATWLTLGSLSGASAGTSASTLTFQAAPLCGSFASATTNTTTVHILNPPAPPKNIQVTLQILTPSPLSYLPAAPKLSYVKGTMTPGYADVTVNSGATPAPFFSVDTTSLPIWLTVDSTTGKVPRSIRFSSTSVAETLPPGTYTGNVLIEVSGSGDMTVPITMLVTNTAPKLTVSEGITRPLNWTVGTSPPSVVITAVSSDSPIGYVAVSGGSLAPNINAKQTSGLAYSFGTQIGINFDSSILAGATPGSVLTGTVTLTWGVPSSTTVVTFNITVLSPGANVSAIAPASLPTALAGQNFTVVLSGSGFVPSPDLTQRTKVGIVVGTAFTADSNLTWNVVNQSSIIVTINVPATADVNLPFAPTGAGGNVKIGVCNPTSGSCAIASGYVTLTIGNGPIVQVVTSASSYIQVNPGQTPTVSPYDIVSIFGTNFCTSLGTGCSSSQILYATPDASLKYPTTLSPDAAGATQRSLTVKFQTQGGSPTLIANASLLFATNNQINLLVPSNVFGSIGSAVDVVVTFGYGSVPATLLSSAPFAVNIHATNPGVFTVGADGQGPAAALISSDYSLVYGNHEAGMRSTAIDSDTILLYVTGLGAPDSIATNTSGGAGAWSADCITPASYVTAVNSQSGSTWTTADGLIIQGSLISTGRLSPCLLTASANEPTVKIGGVAGTVSYAGWVASSIAGLYQINVKLPGSAAGPFTDVTGATVNTITAPVQLPVEIISNSIHSQDGVSLWVAPRLMVAAPSAVSQKVGVSWPSTNNVVIASEGTGVVYRYAVTSGLLPTGVSLNAATGAIAGIPAANTAGTYSVTVTATDYANVPVSGTVSFVLTVTGGLVASASGTAPFLGTFGVANANVTTVSATGGTYPYVYSIVAPVPVGMSVDPATGQLAYTALTPAGTYHVGVLATDSTTGSPLTGAATFDVVIAAVASKTSPVHGNALAINASLSTVSVLGTTGTAHFTLDAASISAGFTIGLSTGIVATTNSVLAGTFPLTVTVLDTGVLPTGAATGGTTTITFNVLIDLVAARTNPIHGTATSATPVITTVSVTGASGTPHYTLDATTAAIGWFSLDLTTGVLGTSASAAAGTYPITVTITDTGTLATGATAGGGTTITFTVIVD